ncbi:MAG: MarR family transcriptional regulator [Bacteroidia bacterium]|nr:MarR family transcriptional regulator [Bacteroidia bacterium]NNJ56030.1 MarR family transcriptional regulator [Bacteroidia bacterium]
MSLEKQIKQKSFSSEAEKAFVNINFTQSYISGLLNAAMKKHNVSVQQFNVLRILKGQHPKPVSVNDITDRMIDKMSNASRLVEKLRLKGLIERSKCSFDKRQVDVSITPTGVALLDQLNLIINEIISNHNHVTSEEYQQLNTLLDKIRKD